MNRPWFSRRFVLSKSELDGRQHPVRDLLAYRIVEHFDVIERILACIARHGLCRSLLPGIRRVLTETEPPRGFRHRIPALGDLGHRITLELIAAVGLPDRCLLSSK